ncbi:hypothetical protein [Nonomuraea solani]|nr:hypothetical protein [Nonomuraea solani]
MPAGRWRGLAPALTLDGGDCERAARRFFCSVSYSGATVQFSTTPVCRSGTP